MILLRVLLRKVPSFYQYLTLEYRRWRDALGCCCLLLVGASLMCRSGFRDCRNNLRLHRVNDIISESKSISSGRDRYTLYVSCVTPPYMCCLKESHSSRRGNSPAAREMVVSISFFYTRPFILPSVPNTFRKDERL